MQHPLHQKIGEMLRSASLGSCELVLDPACGGDQNIPLFVREPKSNATEYCNVDVLFLEDGRVRGIIEIEEANILPTQMCGKLLTSALASFYHHRQHGSRPIPIQDAFFLQVVDSSKLKGDKTSKLVQFENIRESIMNVLPLSSSGVTSYELIAVSGANHSEGISGVVRWIEDTISLPHN
jgi:hypothetical protein